MIAIAAGGIGAAGCKKKPDPHLALTFATQGTGFRVELGPARVIPNPTPPVPIYRWFPDGHITVRPHGAERQMVWAGSSSYRTVGPDVSHMRLDPPGPVLGPGPKGAFDNGGAWLMSVFPVPAGDGGATASRELLGFYHGEDQEWPERVGPPWIAWKSSALATSTDGGASWTKRGQILTSDRPKPATATWGGSGDLCVVRDSDNARWVAFFQEGTLRMATSEDPRASPGTWKKWFRGGFTESGLGGRSTPIPALVRRPGSNPSVHFNDALGRWVMVWHTWTGAVALSSSSDLIRWQPPALLIPTDGRDKNWYPTIVGGTDTRAGADATLYYGHWPDRDKPGPQFLGRSVRFTRM